MSRACAAHAERGGGEWVCRAELARLSKALQRAKESEGRPAERALGRTGGGGGAAAAAGAASAGQQR